MLHFAPGCADRRRHARATRAGQEGEALMSSLIASAFDTGAPRECFWLR
jgi:hypothetical protein